jgi:hypothetical protein
MRLPGEGQPVLGADLNCSESLCRTMNSRCGEPYDGGDVTTTSEPGKGSVFTVRLPGGATR